mmetsp:Transcript_21348/g.59278  ORF Transcript_21348/g.59278 Transcript_21348/m.59278 type:complete len:220 (+) Transcript_21348:591-1250(+)
MILVVCLFAPDLLQCVDAPATVLVRVVGGRVLQIVVLVVVLSIIEFLGRKDLCLNVPAGVGLLNHLKRSLCSLLLRRIHEENGTDIRVTHVAELTIALSWVDIMPKEWQQILVGYLPGIEHNPHSFQMTGAAPDHLVVCRIHLVTTRISAVHRQHSRYFLHRLLPTPEAAHGEYGLLQLLSSLRGGHGQRHRRSKQEHRREATAAHAGGGPAYTRKGLP